MVSNQRAVRLKMSEWKARSFWDSVLNKAEKKGTQVKVRQRQSHKQHSLGVLGVRVSQWRVSLSLFLILAAQAPFYSEHSLSCSAHVISQFPSQGSNPCPLHWKVNLNHQTTREVLQWTVLNGLYIPGAGETRTAFSVYLLDIPISPFLECAIRLKKNSLRSMGLG